MTMLHNMLWVSSNTGTGSSLSYYDQVIATGPTHYWRLGESSGTTAVDAAGSSNGTYYNSPTLAQTGLINSSDTCMSLNGSSQYVGIGVGSYSTSSDFTAEAWFVCPPTTGSTTGYYTVLGSISPPSGWGIRVRDITGSSDWIINLEMQCSTTSANYVSNTALIPGNTYHIVAVWSASAKTWTVYLNGSLFTDWATSTTGVGTIGGNGTLEIGRIPYSGGAQYFIGKIDEVAIYTKALNSTEASDNYQAGL